LKRLAINQRGETVMESTSRIVLKTGVIIALGAGVESEVLQ
jgi:hypothetical protein